MADAADIRAVVSSAREDAQRAPFIWISSASPTRVRGLRAHTITTSPLADAFVRWQWDGDDLVVENDPFGLIPLYVYQRAGEIGLSTSIQKLILEGASVRFDWQALAVFLRLGFFVGEDTAFADIRALSPGTQLVWRDGRCQTNGGLYTVQASDVTRSAAIDQAIALTRESVERRRPDEAFAVPLSGGRDSRHILLALAACGDRPSFTITVPRFPPSAAEDERIAALVASAVGVPHVVVRPTSPPASAEARKNVETSYCADEHAWFYPMLDYVRDRTRVVYEGIGGSLWTVGWLPHRDVRELWQTGRSRDVAGRILDHYSGVGDPFLDDLLAHRPEASRAAAVERLVPEIERHKDAPDPGKSFHFWNRLRRELALVPFDRMRQFGAVHTPLVDRRLVDFLLSLPPEIVSERLSRSDLSFHSDAIFRAYPKFAHIPFEADGAPHTDATAHNRSFTVAVARHLLRRARPFQLMRTAYVVPRLAYTLASRRYASTSRWLATSALYLAQLEDAAA